LFHLYFIDGNNNSTKIKLQEKLHLYNLKGVIQLHHQGIPQAELSPHSKGIFVKNLRPDLLPLILNGEPLEQSLLKQGDLLLLGDSHILYQSEKNLTKKTTKLSLKEPLESRIDGRLKAYKDASSVLESFSQIVHSKKQKQLMLAYQINNLIASLFDLDRLIQEILTLLFEELKADRGFFFLRNEENKKLQLHSRLPSKDKSSKWSNTILKEVFQRKESLLYVYNEDEKKILAGHSLISASVSSVLATPLILKKNPEKKDKILGIIQLDTTAFSSRLFQEDDLSFLNIIGTQVASAIAQVRSYQKRKQYSENLVKLSRCNQLLSSYLTKEQILKEAANSACKLLACTKSSVVIFDASFQKMHIAYAVGFDKKVWKNLEISPETSLCGQVIRREEPLLVQDCIKSPPSESFKTRSRYKSNSFLLAPIPLSNLQIQKKNKKYIGVLCATDKINDIPFNTQEQEFLSIIASQTGIALANAELYEKATIDGLTKLYVRRYFFQKLETLISRSLSQKDPLGLMILDLDFFKRQNDTYGHQTGDVILKEFGTLLKSSIREHDIAARYGGEEFAVILYRTNHKDSELIAERIRYNVEKHEFNKESLSIRITVSIGLTNLEPDETATRMLNRADKNLYLAKSQGRNRVVF
jgi:diguanylate cyclase (GGDEF)-like protein